MTHNGTLSSADCANEHAQKHIFQYRVIRHAAVAFATLIKSEFLCGALIVCHVNQKKRNTRSESSQIMSSMRAYGFDGGGAVCAQPPNHSSPMLTISIPTAVRNDSHSCAGATSARVITAFSTRHQNRYHIHRTHSVWCISCKRHVALFRCACACGVC